MQKNVPKYAPEWLPTTSVWAQASHREITYALCNDRRTLLWFANQRAVEYHVTLMRAKAASDTSGARPGSTGRRGFDVVVASALLVRQALTDAGLSGAVKTSGAKGLHIYVPLDEGGFRRRGGGHQGDRGTSRTHGPLNGDYRVHHRGP